MENLPDVPFRKILSYLNLEDLIKLKSVSWRWYWMLDGFTISNLCYSRLPVQQTYERGRLFRGEFTQNFISTSRIVSLRF